MTARWLVALILSAVVPTLGAASPRVFYAGGAGAERFNDVLPLSDGTFLIAGQADSLDWLPPQTPRVQLDSSGVVSTSPGNIGFVLHVSSTLDQVLDVAHFPAGSVRDVYRLRQTSRPGEATGAVYLSGTRDGATPGYFIGRLDANWVNGRPTALSWVHNADAAAGSSYQLLQPWDVGGDGAVVFGRGKEYDANWAVMERLDAQGQRVVVNHWHAHWFDDPAIAGDQEWDGTPASAYGGTLPLKYSGLVLKAQRRGSLRSTTQADYDLLQPDGNGNSGRKGRFPDDYYFSGPCVLSAGGACPGGPGYTGYRINQPTQRLGGVAIDRRNGTVYFGYSTQTRLPGGEPDYEPAVVAMAADGRLLWWNRLYRETSANSSPDQYVDAVAIDYAHDELVVLARSHGNNTENLWRGNAIAARPGARGFQNQFTGTNGNIHLSWLGKFALARNELQAATYVGEFVEGSNNYGALLTDPLLSDWPDPNSGWPNLNTTRNCNDVDIGADGSVAVTCKGRRTITTRAAWQTMPPPVGAGASLVGSWNSFVRVYASDLSTVIYSSLLTGRWDTTTGVGGDNIRVDGIALAGDRLVATGTHAARSTVDAVCTPARVAAAAARPADLPTGNIPAWGAAASDGQSAVAALLPRRGDGLFRDGFEP